MQVATLADSWAGIIYTGTWYITYCGMLWSSSGEHCGSARGHQQHKIWISSGGTLSPPLRRTFVFLSRVHCGGLEVGGGGSHWLMGGQSAHRQLLPYSPPNPLIHPTLLSFSDSIAALNIHSPDLRGQSWPIIRQYSPTTTTTTNTLTIWTQLGSCIVWVHCSPYYPIPAHSWWITDCAGHLLSFLIYKWPMLPPSGWPYQ